MKRHIQEFPMDFQLRTSFDNPSQPNIKEYKHVKFPSLIMNYIKEGHGINGEIPKDDPPTNFMYSPTSIVFMPIKAHRRQTWSQNFQSFINLFAYAVVASATICQQQEHKSLLQMLFPCY